LRQTALYFRHHISLSVMFGSLSSYLCFAKDHPKE